MFRPLLSRVSLPLVRPSWWRRKVRRRFWVAGIAVFCVCIFLRHALSDEEIENLLLVFESRSAAYTADEAAALSETLPAIDDIADPRIALISADHADRGGALRAGVIGDIQNRANL